MSSGLLILIPTFPWENPNLESLLPALRANGIDPLLAATDSLQLADAQVWAADQQGSFHALTDRNLVWVLGFGSRNNFLDKLQLLKLAAERVPFVNNPDAFVYLHAKYHLTNYRGALRHPETFASHNARWLYEKMRGGGEWIAKPPAASFGRGVFKLTYQEPNAQAILDQLTDYGRGAYGLLQRYVPEIAQGEKRVLIAAGQIIGAYRRESIANGITNLAAGARATRCELTDEETDACAELARDLAVGGVNYAGIDLVYPWLIEINVANPGGLRSLVELGDGLAPARLAARVMELMPSG